MTRLKQSRKENNSTNLVKMNEQHSDIDDKFWLILSVQIHSEHKPWLRSATILPSL